MLNTADRTAFNTLLAELAGAFAREPRRGAGQAAASLRCAASGTYRRRQATSSPGALLQATCGLDHALPLAGLVWSCHQLLDWTCWQGDGLADTISARLHSTELVGPDGHVRAADVRVGLLLSEPHTDYPLSRHAGEETYLVLAGTAEWTLEDQPYQRHRPGVFVHHPAWVEHGRRTSCEPFLGAWRWSGNLDLTSFRVS